jgi:hypothetical protein
MTRQPKSTKEAESAGKRSEAGRRPTPINPRARSRAVTPDVKRDRIFCIASTMAIGEWNDEHAEGLREKWGLTAVYLRFMAAEASRLLEYTTNDRAKLIAAARVRLQQIAAQDGPDRVLAQRTLLEHLGEMRRRVEMSGPDGREIPIGVTARVVVLPAEEPDDEPPG